MSVRLLHLASPALPIGGFSYSSGLEWGIESGQVRDEATAREWIADALALTLSGFEAPLMLEALRRLRDVAQRAEAPSDGADTCFAAIDSLNAEALAARETREMRLESEQMGYSLGRWVAEVCGDAPRLPAPVSLPVAWAAAAHRLGLDDREAALGLLWSFAENQVMVLMKALPMGQVAAQRLLLSLGPGVEAAVSRALDCRHSEWTSAAPALAIASMKHETQYSRLFRS
jgi:urease accessory protein